MGTQAIHTSPAGPPANAARPARWQVRLLGAVEVSDGLQCISHFPSRAVAALLARLALAPDRAFSREELVELLWPGVDLAVGRNRLRQALSTLKSLLEPADRAGDTVLLADRLHVRAAPGALACDARAFEGLARAGRTAEARGVYGGDLMPGFYDEWIEDERRRLAAVHDALAGGTAAEVPLLRPNEQPHAPPPHPTAAAGPTALRLPTYLTRLFGAEVSAARLRTQVLAHRLVTLLGPGGSGKTRLAVEVAGALRDGPVWALDRPAEQRADTAPRGFDSVAFVPLVNCSTGAQMLAAMAAALHVAPGRVSSTKTARGEGDDAHAQSLDALLAALAGRHVLLVLDNLEQLVGSAAPLLADLLAQLPRLHLLVTSRHLLGLDGERCVVIEPLAVPEPDASLQAAAANPAVALFCDRARAARADFHLGPRNASDLVALVRALQGMPLAIELAAARIRAFSPREMLQRLVPAAESTSQAGTPGLDLLARSGPRAGLDARHASMQRTIEWGWQLLSEAERELLCGLTLFRGGWTAAAVRGLAAPAAHAEAVDGPAEAGPSAADLHLQLDALVAHSLVAAPLARGGDAPADSQREQGARFFLYEPIREFAAARMSSEAAARWRSRHRHWIAAWTDAMPLTPDLAEVRAEMPNLEAALASAVADGQAEAAVTLLLQLRRVLEDVELPATAMLHAQAAVAACADPVLQSRGHSLLGPLLLLAGRGDAALAAAQAGLDSAPAEPLLRGRALHSLARVRWRAHRDAERTLALIASAQPLAIASDDLELQAGLLALRAFVSNRANGDHALAHTLHEQALALWQRLGNRHAVHSGLYNLAVTAQLARQNEAALELLDRLSQSAVELHDWRRLSQAANVAGTALAELRRWPEAAVALRRALQVAWRTMAHYELAFPLWNLSRALAHLRQPERAMQLASFAASYWERNFGSLAPADHHDLRRVRRLVARQIDSRRAAAAWDEGAKLELAAAVALALQA